MEVVLLVVGLIVVANLVSESKPLPDDNVNLGQTETGLVVIIAVVIIVCLMAALGLGFGPPWGY